MKYDTFQAVIELAKAASEGLDKQSIPKSLREHIATGEDIPFGSMLRHPLFYMIPFFGSRGEVKMASERIDKKKELVSQCVEEKNMLRVLMLHERPYRLDAFLKYSGQIFLSMSEEDRKRESAESLSYIWTDSENIWQNLSVWKKLWMSAKVSDSISYAMEPDDKKFLSNLFEGKDVVTIYRGASERNARGLSWTTDRKKACWFAKRLHKEGIDPPASLYEAEVRREDVLATFAYRGESEVLVDPFIIETISIQQTIL